MINTNCEKTIHELISEQCIAKPYSIAIYEYEKKLTYGQLEKRSNKVASMLIHKGIQVGKSVCIISDRRIELIITALAILKTGGVYVPIDSSYPQKRIYDIIEDSQCKVVINLTQDENLLSGLNLVELHYNQLIKGYCGEVCLPKIKTTSLAYIIYTSGTTGKPKGVTISHKAVLNTFNWMSKEFNLTYKDRIGHKTSISFTDSIWEIFWPLLNGAKISIINDIHAKNPRSLYNCLLKQKIKITQFVPSMLNVFLDYIEISKKENPLPDLKWIFNGGEHITVNLVKKFNQLFRNAKIGNIYGSTETAIYATCYIIEKNLKEDLQEIPIGWPIENTDIYICKDDNEVCEVNEKGEICVSGIGISSGYWNSVEMNKTKFIPIFNGQATMYRTGDIGYKDNNGCIWYCGRLDNQVKIRGNRVEIFDVEKNILEYDGIYQVAVIAKKDKYNDNYLVCYLTNKEINIDDLDSFLKNRLPSFMIPKWYKVIDQFPLSINKKIDTKKLAALEINV